MSWKKSQAEKRGAGIFNLGAWFLTELNLETVWQEVAIAERQILVEDLVESVRPYPFRLFIQVTGCHNSGHA
jgi:hypothetical protein